MIYVSKKRDNYLDYFKQVHGQDSSTKKEDLLPLQPLRYKKKLPMLRLKKSLHPHVLADPDDDTEDDDQYVEDAELTSPFGSMLGRSKKIWFNNRMTRGLPISWPFPLSKTIKYKVDKKRYQHPSQLSWYERLGQDEQGTFEYEGRFTGLLHLKPLGYFFSLF